jgi:hypothetical protein
VLLQRIKSPWMKDCLIRNVGPHKQSLGLQFPDDLIGEAANNDAGLPTLPRTPTGSCINRRLLISLINGHSIETARRLRSEKIGPGCDLIDSIAQNGLAVFKLSAVRKIFCSAIMNEDRLVSGQNIIRVYLVDREVVHVCEAHGASDVFNLDDLAGVGVQQVAGLKVLGIHPAVLGLTPDAPIDVKWSGWWAVRSC